ncbi:cytoplasmic FMR1 interacting protein [Dioscorea alata]|uniref:Cytoplasmic FMR1 interacting protein n=1 Tax=Dioscorea alata TaxID=55571 RepID=A0ACB7WS43_DIOAL|nr:cytoplasmic FMR1 interacting protein [Dioscorea alata]
MAIPVEEAIAALSTFSLEDEQPDVQGLSVSLSCERYATNSPIEYGDVSAYRLSLTEDTKAINQLNTLIQEGKEMASVLYTYRSCVKALPQLPDSMKHSQADLYLETYQVLDLEMSRLREIQRWQASAASKLAADMQRFSRPERLINGPTITHYWSMLRLLDVLVQLDHLKNAKASIPNDFSWYKRTFTQVSAQWQETDSMREELDDLQIFLSTRWAILLNLHAEMFRVNTVEDILHVLIVFCVESLELDFALLYPERHALLRVLPVLVVLATSSEKDSESLYKRVKINRLINIFKNDPVIPAFPDLHLSPASILKELSMYFPNFSSQTRLLTLPAPHEIPPREMQEYQRNYLVINHIGAIRAEHDEFAIRFASAMNQIVILKSTEGADGEWSRDVKGNMYDVVVDGFQLLSKWTGKVWEQCAWKFARPCKDLTHIDTNKSTASYFDYEKVVRWNYSFDERRAMLELISYIKGIGSMMQRCDALVADALWETIHVEVQDFVQDKLDVMLRSTFRKKKDLSRILSDMRTLSADWMANTSKAEPELHSMYQESGEAKTNTFYPRPVAPTAAQVHCLQFLICELVSGGNLRKPGGLFGNSGTGIPIDDLKQLETFFYKLSFFLHILDYTATIGTLTDLGFLWFREFYLESSRVIQFPIECSLPWMLVDHVIESRDAGLIESILMPFDIYNDSAQHALVALKQRFLYDEIEAEVDLCFDLLVLKLSEIIFSYYKSCAACELLDKAFIAASDDSEKYSVQPIRFNEILKLRRVKLLGRTIDLRSLITQRMNKLFRENIDFLFDHFENQDLCAVMELQQLLEVLKLTHKLLMRNLELDSFSLMLNEMQENLSLVSFSSRLVTQIWTEMQNDFLPNFILCNTTQRFVRSPKGANHTTQKASLPNSKAYYYCGNQDLNLAYQNLAELYHEFFGIPHMFAIVQLIGSRSLPLIIRALLDHISNKITTIAPRISGLQEALPKAIGLLPFDGGVAGCHRSIHEQLTWGMKTELKTEALHNLKEIGSAIYFMGLLDIVLRESDTTQFIQTAPWLGFITGSDGQAKQVHGAEGSPIVHLLRTATATIVSNPTCPNPSSFLTMSKQAEAAELLYKTNLKTGSVLEYALAFTSAALDKHYSKWSANPKTGFIDITTSKDFYRIFSGLQFEYLEETVINQSKNHDILGDSVAWAGCTIMYLLGQQLHFELFDFSYQFLNVAEVEGATLMQHGAAKSSVFSQGYENLLEAMRKARRLNNHVFSMLRARCPLEDKVACAIKQSGAPIPRIKFVNTVSAFETLPQKGA